jgi:hypothetical protein
MRPVRALLIYIVFVFLGGALLAPWLFWLAQSTAQAFPNAFGQCFQKLAANPFHRYVDRSLLALALIGLPALSRALGAKSFREIGLVKPVGQWQKFFAGLLLGFLSLALVIGLALLFKARVLDGNLSAALLTKKLLGAAATALIVAMLEEILFRGGIFGGLRRSFDWRFALILSSGVYAIVHFLERAELSGPVTWLSGLQLLPQMLHGFLDTQKLFPGFFNLTLVGALLALAYRRTGNLWFSIGLHAGWIFWLKSSGIIAGVAPGAHVAFWGSGKLIDGWLAFLVLLATLALSGKFFPTKSKTTMR